MVRVLIADDSPLVRDVLLAVLSADPGLEIVGLAADGEEAVRLTRELAPDVISMDLRMPRLGGVEAIREIMHERPTPIVALYADDGGLRRGLGLAALGAGALEVVSKPRLETGDEIREFRRTFATLLKLMAEVKVIRIVRAAGAHGHPAAWQAGPPPDHAPVAAVGVCASTGGPSALKALLAELAAPFPAPVFVVQHIADGFLGGLVEWLAPTSTVRVAVAEHGALAGPGTAYFAPDGAHLVVGPDGRMALTSDPPVRSHRPSGDVMLGSLAGAFGERSMAVVLSGMGEDGADGAGAVAAAGGVVLAQDEASSVVYGMPRAVAERGIATEVLALDDLAARMAYWARAGFPPEGTANGS